MDTSAQDRFKFDEMPYDEILSNFYSSGTFYIFRAIAVSYVYA